MSAAISGPSRLFTGVMCCVFMTLFFVISLQRGLDLPGGIDTIIEEPTTTVRPSSVNEYSHQTARLLNLCLMFVCREQCRGRRDPRGERGDVRFDRSHHPTVLHRQHQHCFHGNAPTALTEPHCEDCQFESSVWVFSFPSLLLRSLSVTF